MPKAVITDGINKKETKTSPEPEVKQVEEEEVQEETAPEPEEGAVDTQVEDDDEDLDGVPLESLDPEEELWEGGPTVGQALEWKNQYGRLFITSLDYDDHILWRPLLRSEYKNHVRHIEKLTSSGKMSQFEANLLNEELLAQTCMLWPMFDPNEESLAGIPAIIAQEIMEASGFVALQVRQL